LHKPWIVAAAAVLLPLAAAAQQPTALELEGAWVRALPPSQENTAAYLTVRNPGEVAVTIVGGSAGIAQTVEIHTTREIDGYMRMEQLLELSVPAGQSVQLAPGGTHLMLMGLSRMPVPGESVQLCLELAAGGPVCAAAEVRKSAAGQHNNHRQHH
jgi:copper(I)-binding protein